MSEAGCVTLVGAGPGDPGLLTLAGGRALEQAEVVLYDRLVGEAVLALIPSGAERVDVGKNKGRHPTPQGEINRLLLHYAEQGRNVVRLKGGDPYLFGRGAEELELLAERGIPFRVIPGVTSAIAVPAYAGIPVTHRDHSSSVHIITGHGREGRDPEIAWKELAGCGGTLVFLMGLTTLPDISGGLLRAGMPPDTPAALIENGTRPDQRRLVSTIAGIPGEAAAAGFAPPSVLVVGAVCALAERFDWMSRLPLRGRRILAVSSGTTTGRLASLLRALGCAVDELPCIAMRPLPQTGELWNGIGETYSWIVLTSRYGAELFFDEARRREVDVRRFAATKFAVVGPGTAEILRSRGIFPDFVPAAYSAGGLAEGLPPLLPDGGRVLLYRAASASRDLDAALRERDIPFTVVNAYETLQNDVETGETRRKVADGFYDLATFTSASAVNAFAAAMGEADLAGMHALCIGGMTAAAAGKLGMSVETSPEATLASMVETIVAKRGE